MKDGYLVLVVVLVLVCAGCGGATTDTPGSEDATRSGAAREATHHAAQPSGAGSGSSSSAATAAEEQYAQSSSAPTTLQNASEAQYGDESGAVDGGSSSASGSGEVSAASRPAGILTDTVEYGVTITGTTFHGDTNFPTEQTVYTPAENFQLAGKLIVTQGLEQSGANFNNGINSKDIGLIVGDPASSPSAGSIWFATNTGIFVMAGFGGETQEAQLDVASVVSDEGQGTISIQIDPNAARTSQLNTFNVESGLLASVYQPLAGNMQLQFEDGGRSVSGSADFVGSGLIEP